MLLMNVMLVVGVILLVIAGDGEIPEVTPEVKAEVNDVEEIVMNTEESLNNVELFSVAS